MSDPPIKTASWFAPLADDHIRVGISRGTPRRFPAGFRMYRNLAPGPWFNTMPLDDTGAYLRHRNPWRPGCCAGPRRPHLPRRWPHPRALLLQCPGRGEWCHLAIAAQWLAEALGLQVPEVGFETHAPARSTGPAGLNFPCHRDSQHEPRPDPHRDRQTARGPAPRRSPICAARSGHRKKRLREALIGMINVGNENILSAPGEAGAFQPVKVRWG